MSHPPIITTVGKRSRAWKWLILGPLIIAAIVFIIVFIAVLNVLSGDDGDGPVPGAAETTASEKTASETTVAEPEEQEPEPSADTDQAKEWNQAALNNFGYDTWAEGCTDPDVTWPCYVADTGTLTEGTLLVTLQIPADDPQRQQLGEDAAMALLNLVGFEDETLDAVQTQDAEGGAITNVSRSESPLLDG